MFSDEDGFKVEGLEVGMVTLMGKILSADHGETKSTIVIEDHTGSIEVVQWHDENSESPQDQQQNGIVDGANVRVLGSVRTQKDKRYIMVKIYIKSPNCIWSLTTSSAKKS